MPFNYNPLWIKLVEKGMTKTELRKEIGIGTATLAKLSNNEKVSMDVLEKICGYLNCQVSDIVTYIPEGFQNPIKIIIEEQ